jgi:hypothetical protein
LKKETTKNKQPNQTTTKNQKKKLQITNAQTRDVSLISPPRPLPSLPSPLSPKPKTLTVFFLHKIKKRVPSPPIYTFNFPTKTNKTNKKISFRRIGTFLRRLTSVA